ncbi:MAG: alkyl hydroperoxide reductase subunit F, partial [Acetobacteraceae bacterium]
MLDATLKSQLQAYLERITRPVHLVASLDDGASSREMRALLQDIVALSDKVTLEERDDDARKPSFAITSPGHDISLRFAGLPMGHE